MNVYQSIPQELAEYLPPLTRQPDFERFWEQALCEGMAVPLCASRRQAENFLNSITVFQISFHGFDKTPVAGYFVVPKNHSEKLSCIVMYHGFGGKKPEPYSLLPYTDLGYCVLAIDVRGQSGETGDKTGYRTGGKGHSVMCQGILDQEEYYLKRIYIDAVKAIEFAAAQPEVDVSNIVIMGGSQGGALAMAACALSSLPSFCFCDVPSNSNIEARILGANGSFGAVTDYLRTNPQDYEQVHKVLSYFDTMNLADRITCPVSASVGLKDTVCPAKHYFASYNRITAPKEIHLYPYSGHEGGGEYQMIYQLRKLKDLAGRQGSSL